MAKQKDGLVKLEKPSGEDLKPTTKTAFDVGVGIAISKSLEKTLGNVAGLMEDPALKDPHTALELVQCLNLQLSKSDAWILIKLLGNVGGSPKPGYPRHRMDLILASLRSVMPPGFGQTQPPVLVKGTLTMESFGKLS